MISTLRVTFGISRTVWLIKGSIRHCAKCFVYSPLRMSICYTTITMCKTKCAVIVVVITLVWRHSYNRHIELLVNTLNIGPVPAKHCTKSAEIGNKSSRHLSLPHTHSSQAAQHTWWFHLIEHHA